MRARSAHDVTISVSNDLTMGGGGVIFGPNVDGYVLPDTIMSLVRSGKQNHVSVIVGSTADEFTIIAPVMLPRDVKTEEEYRAAIVSYFSSISSSVPAEAIISAYPSTTYASRKQALIAMVSDFVYTCPARMLTRALSSLHKAPVRRFLYSHTFTDPGWSDYRAAHGLDLMYLFGPLPDELMLHLDHAEEALSLQMIRSWVNFASTGLPEAPGLSNWAPYNPGLDDYLVLDTPPHPGHAV
jgi:para-nitrobenzyl esterase